MDENIIKMICSEMNRYLNNYQMSKLNEALYKRLDSNDNEISNNEYLDKFINSKKLEGCSNLTIRNYNTHIIKLFEYLNKDIRTVDTQDLREYLSFYQGINNCNNATIDGVRRSLSSFFTFLEEEDYIIKSPTRRIHKIKTEKLVKETYSDEVLERLRNKCDNIRNLAIIDLLSSSGMRISELVNLNIEDINFENKSCIVFGKGKKMREVYFDGKAKLHLQEYLTSRKDDNKALIVSLYKPYKRISYRGIETMPKRLGEEIGVHKVHPHKFRRTLATRAIDKGMPIELVQHLLGHTKIDTTLHYAMVNQSNVKISHRKFTNFKNNYKNTLLLLFVYAIIYTNGGNKMNDEEKILNLINNNNGLLKTSEVTAKNINKMALSRLVHKGMIERIARGLYINSSNIEDSYFIFQYKCPKAIFSHETALYFHDLTDRTPIELMVTVPSKYNSRLLKNSEYKFSYIKDELYELGKTKVKTPYGNEVYCYDIERTICDIIRDKNKIERYQLTDALKRYMSLKVKDISKLYRYAEKFNIKDEVKKYIEVLN